MALENIYLAKLVDYYHKTLKFYSQAPTQFQVGKRKTNHRTLLQFQAGKR